MSQGKWLNNIARLIQTGEGKFGLVFERPQDKDGNYIGEDPFPLTINEGDWFQAKLKKDDLKRLVDSGKMSQETADKICKRVKFEFSRAPKDDAPVATRPEKKNTKQEEPEW